MNRKLEAVKAVEGAKYASFIKNCYDFASTPAQINAQKIAGLGGTAWKAPTGL